MPSADRILDQNAREIGVGTSRFAPRFSYVASNYDNSKYNVTGLSYPEDLTSSNAYGNNKVIFYINVSVDSKVLKAGTNVGIAEGVQRDMRGDLVAQKYTGAQGAAGAAGTGALVGAVAGVATGWSNGTSPKGKAAGAALKGLLGAGVGAAPGLATAAAIASNTEAPPGSEHEPIFSRPQKRLQAAIALYIPNQLNVRYSAGWSDEETAEFQAFARGAQEGGRAMAGNANVARSGGLAEEVLGALAINKGPGGQALGIASGLAANPKKEQSFKNVDFRTFSFDYNFAPRSETEAQNVLNIIRAFKYHMHPELKENGFLYIYPSEFDIVYYKNNQENLNIHRHTSCVLTEMNVNYTPNGVFSTFPNGMPTQITMTLTFKELMLLSKELVEKYT
jgi:hypothetical protein